LKSYILWLISKKTAKEFFLNVENETLSSGSASVFDSVDHFIWFYVVALRGIPLKSRDKDMIPAILLL
jgi:hypothetical protein